MMNLPFGRTSCARGDSSLKTQVEKAKVDEKWFQLLSAPVQQMESRKLGNGVDLT